MKPLVMLVLFICLCSLYALTAPTNVRAAAIGHDAFTLRWDAVGGATGYTVEVLEAVDEFLVDTGFEGLTVFPEGWLNNDKAVVLNAGSIPNLAYQGTYFCGLKQNGYVILPSFNEPYVLRFWVKAQHLNVPAAMKIQLIGDAFPVTDLMILQARTNGLGEIVNTYREIIVPVNPEGFDGLRVKLVRTSGSQDFHVDDLRMQAFSGYPVLQSTSSIAIRPLGLSANQEYTYRVRATAVLQTGPFSDWQSLTTLAEAPANAAYGSAINSSPATIDLPQIGTFSPQSIQISPSESADADYMVEVGIEAGGISYTVSSDSGAALNGDYLITHPGYNATSIDASMGKLSIIELGNGFTSFNIDGFISKGTLHIFLALDETLPVQMGRMMLVPVGVNGVNLQWFSYSESELAGYYVLRSESNDLNQAQYVSSMIEATNTSSTVHYMFQDADASENCYYWLEARDYTGASEFFGPEYYEKQSPGNDTPPILKDTLHAIYPNPFNPSTTISYSLAEPQAISIKIYDARGRLVHRHDEANKDVGRHQYIWNAEHTASGVYFLKLGIGERSFERKLVLLK